jgi:molecular chaperone HscB
VNEFAAKCSKCGAELESPLGCTACGTLAAPEREPTPFEVFGLAPSFALDAAQLRRKLLRLGRVLHPDFFGAADEATRALAERNSARLHRAHDVLADDAARADWLVRHLGGPSENEQREMPKAFLLEVLEWNEQLEAARESAPGSRERAALAGLEAELKQQRERALSAVARLLEPLPPSAAPTLREARSQLNALRYLDNTLAQIEALALGAPSSH